MTQKENARVIIEWDDFGDLAKYRAVKVGEGDSERIVLEKGLPDALGEFGWRQVHTSFKTNRRDKAKSGQPYSAAMSLLWRLADEQGGEMSEQVIETGSTKQTIRSYSRA